MDASSLDTPSLAYSRHPPEKEVAFAWRSNHFRWPPVTHTRTRPCLLSYHNYNKHVCVCACVRACVRNGRSPEVIRPPGKWYFFLWGMATVGQREGAQWAGIHNASVDLNDRLCTQGWWRVWSSTRPICDIASRRGSSTWVPLLHIKA